MEIFSAIHDFFEVFREKSVTERNLKVKLNILKTKGTSLLVHNVKGQTCLHVCVEKNDVKTLKYLLEKENLDVDAHDAFGNTPLHIACAKGYSNLVEFLFKRGAKVDSLSERMTTPLHEAAQSGNAKVVEFLIEHGAIINPQTDTGMDSPLLRVFRGVPNIDVVKMLVKESTELNQTAFGIPLLVEAVVDDSLELVKFFLESGALPNYGAENGVPQPLLFACSLKRTSEAKAIVSALLAFSADPNFISPYGVKAVEVAAFNGHREVVEALVPMTDKIENWKGNWDANTILNYVNTNTYKKRIKIASCNYINSLIKLGDGAETKDALSYYNRALLLSRQVTQQSLTGHLALKVARVLLDLKEASQVLIVAGFVLNKLTENGRRNKSAYTDSERVEAAELACCVAKANLYLKEYRVAHHFHRFAADVCDDKTFKDQLSQITEEMRSNVLFMLSNQTTRVPVKKGLRK